MTDASEADAFETDVFEMARPRLVGRAYRIVGTFVDAEDVVQEAWLRWSSIDQESVDNPDAWLNTVVTRLAIDQLRRRKRDEDRYVGQWLPTPTVVPMVDPSEAAVAADSLTTAFLVMLERLTPDERAAFLMADVFGERFDEIASSMGRSVASCRQLASRARRKVRGAEVQRRDERDAATIVAGRFLQAIVSGDEASALACLDPDVVYVGDGGSARRAARNPVVGPDRVARFLINIAKRFEIDDNFEPAWVGGFPGFTITGRSGLWSATSLEVVDGKIVRVMTMMNPDKLSGLHRSVADLE